MEITGLTLLVGKYLVVRFAVISIHYAVRKGVQKWRLKHVV